MSTSKRKIGFYCIEFKRRTIKEEEKFFFDKELFCDLLEFINADVSDEDKLIRNERSNKATALESYDTYEKDGNKFVKLIFKTCKYNHSPDYMSSADGSERESDKSLDEGEKERTHLLGKLKDDEVEVVLEERKSGISISGIIKYINKFIRAYNESKGIKKSFRFEYGIVPMDEFEENLENLNRVCGADIFMHKQLLGSEGLDIMERNDDCMRDEIVIACKVKKSESLVKRNLKKIYQSAISEGEKITRIRVYGKDSNNINILLDSNVIKRVEYIDASLDDTKGTVDSHAFFSKVEEIFGVDE